MIDAAACPECGSILVHGPGVYRCINCNHTEPRPILHVYNEPKRELGGLMAEVEDQNQRIEELVAERDSLAERLRQQDEWLANSATAWSAIRSVLDGKTSAGFVVDPSARPVIEGVERLRAALAFYADPANWRAGGDGTIEFYAAPMGDDEGKRAREALKETP